MAIFLTEQLYKVFNKKLNNWKSFRWNECIKKMGNSHEQSFFLIKENRKNL